MMAIDEQIRSMILQRASAGEIRGQASTEGMKNLRQDGWRLVRDGRTTLTEVLRVTKDERLAANGLAASESTDSKRSPRGKGGGK